MEGENHGYPLDSKCYKFVGEIGRGASSVVHKATCCINPIDFVAIKIINLQNSNADFKNEAEITTHLRHPNILRAHCSFTVVVVNANDKGATTYLWVVMPFMPGGSLHSIIASSYPDGLPEPFIASVLKEILTALNYLHDQGYAHRDIKAGNILLDSNGSVKLADFGFSASVYAPTVSYGRAGSSSRTLFTGTPYWMAPEVIHSHTVYEFTADIWAFGITALELGYGRPPLSLLPPSNSFAMRDIKNFRFSKYYDETKAIKKKEFSKPFKSVVGLCLVHEASKRPSAETLLKHSFFYNCKEPDLCIKHALQGVPAVEQRFKEAQVHYDEEEGASTEEILMKYRRISGWKLNEEELQLDPGFPGDNAGGVVGAALVASMMRSLEWMMENLDKQKLEVWKIMVKLGRPWERTREEDLVQKVAELKKEVEEREKEQRLKLEMEKLQLF